MITPKCLTWLDDLITMSLQVKSWTFFNFLLGPNRMHSVFPRWRESVLSKSLFEHCFKAELHFSYIADGSLLIK